MIKSKKIKTFIIQPFNTPYRNGLFNEISKLDNIELSIIYENRFSENRKLWILDESRYFAEIQLRTFIHKIDYYTNLSFFDPIQVIYILIKYRPEVIIASPTYLGIFLSYFKRLFGFKLIYWSESTYVVEKGNKFKRKHLNFIKNIDNIIVPGKLAKEYILYASDQKLLGIPFFFAPYSVDESVFKISENELIQKFNRIDCLKISFIGSYVELKGFNFLLEAIKILNKKNNSRKIEFYFIGDGPLKDQLQNIQNVHSLGFKQKNAIAEFLIKSHILILPSLQDCNPLVIIEAAKTGNIILCSDGVGNYPEMVDKNGYIFKRGSAEEIINVLQHVISLTNSQLLKLAQRSIELSININHKNTAKLFLKAITQ
jgi:glycosyltransferase involved in cell wall biosynthesis